MGEDHKPARGPQPVAWHPLFPAIVAVWFGALFGLGALAVRVSLLERLAVASGIDLIVPAAAPPLGMNARILIALILAMTGGVVGAVVGNLMARSKPSAQARRAEAAAAKAEKAVEAANAAAPAPTARTSSVDAPSFIDISQLDLDADSGPEPETAATTPEAEYSAAVPRPNRSFAPALDSVSFPLPAPFPLPGGAAAQRLTSADLDDLSHLELIERLALSLQKRREKAGEAAHLEPSLVEKTTSLPNSVPHAEAAQPPAPSYYPPAPEPIGPRLARIPTGPRPAESDPAAERLEIADEASADSYGSLLGLGRTPAQSDRAGPVALFPGQQSAAPRQDPVATERALRDALAALQRMSGAA